MKPSTENSYHERIDRVVGYLSEQVDNSPSLTALADVAAISPFHFHRVYRAVTGETPSMTLRRLKLSKACFLLRDTNKTVTEIAFEAAYDSSQNFAKAFRAGTGFSPTEIRKTPGESKWGIVADHTIVPSIENIVEAREALEKTAIAGSGYYDGWEAAITR